MHIVNKRNRDEGITTTISSEFKLSIAIKWRRRKKIKM